MQIKLYSLFEKLTTNNQIRQYYKGDIQAVTQSQLTQLEYQKVQNDIKNDNIDIHNNLINKQKIYVTVPESGYINQFDIFSANKIVDLNSKLQQCINSCQAPHLPVLTPIQYYTGLIECQYTLLKYAYATVMQLLTLTYKYDFNFAKVADEMKNYSAIQCLEIFITYIIALERNENCLTPQEIQTYQAFKPFYQQLLWCDLDKDAQQNQLAYFETELVSQSIIKQTDICFGLIRLAQARINYIANKLNAQIVYPPMEQTQLNPYEAEIMKSCKQEPTFILPQNVTQEQYDAAVRESIKNISYKTVIATVPTYQAVDQLTQIYDTNTNQKDIDMKLFSTKASTFTANKYIKCGDLIQNINKTYLPQLQNMEFTNHFEFELKPNCTLENNSSYACTFRYTAQDEFVLSYAITPSDMKDKILKQIRESENPQAVKTIIRIKKELDNSEISIKQLMILEKLCSK